jgi:membrane protease YdiL (CAAX protease family)
MIRIAGLLLGTAPPGRLLYGVTVGPIVEEVIFRGAAFSVIYVTASSIGGLANSRIALSIAVSSLLFALAHTTLIGIPWIVFFGMGMLYALLRWRSNSTAAAALMHATYNAVIAFAMLRH